MIYNSKINFKMFYSLLYLCTYLALNTGSTPTVGSSNMRSCGSWSNATAKDTLLSWPPLRYNCLNVKLTIRYKNVNTFKMSHEPL